MDPSTELPALLIASLIDFFSFVWLLGCAPELKSDLAEREACISAKEVKLGFLSTDLEEVREIFAEMLCVALLFVFNLAAIEFPAEY